MKQTKKQTKTNEQCELKEKVISSMGDCITVVVSVCTVHLYGYIYVKKINRNRNYIKITDQLLFYISLLTITQNTYIYEMI